MLTGPTPSVQAPPSSSGSKLRRILIAVLVFALIAAAVVVKLMFFPSVREDYFALSERNLQRVRSGLVVLRPTRFVKFHFNGVVATAVRLFGKPVPRLMGRNVSFRELIATAYGHNPGTLVLPSDTPSTNFDFLITARGDPQEILRQAIRRKLGFIARVEPHDAEVLAVKVKNADLPGLAVSSADKKPNVNYQDGRLCFTHFRVSAMTASLEQVLGTPVVDKTGLTDFYDFCVTWSPEQQRHLGNYATARPPVDKILNDLGLTLQPDRAPVEMLVVKRASP